MLQTISTIASLLTLVLITMAILKISRIDSSKNIEIDVASQIGPIFAAFEERSLNSLSRHKEELRTNQTENSRMVQEAMEKIATALREESRSNRKEVEEGRQALERAITSTLEGIKKEFQGIKEEFKAQGDTNERRIADVRITLQTEMEKLREGNEAKLEKMRETVDEKLQGTLDKRLGESFNQVSEHLRAVQSGLGEMKSLATGVGDLKRVLTNVKNRGGWGEVQLGRQLEDVLTRDQYEMNISLRHGSNEKVEYAIKFPGRIEGEFVYLPIDAKFPHEDYERLVQAQESGNLEEVDSASKEIEKRIKSEAEKIHEKYVNPPLTTDFAIMYLPTEGLYAEVIRRPGLVYELQNKYRVLVTGPTTLLAILNSLQMGFKTLAIEKSTSEVWKILGAVKHEFEKYSKVWEKLDTQLSRAQTTVQNVATRSRSIQRSLRSVESISDNTGGKLLELTDYVTEVEDPSDESEEE